MEKHFFWELLVHHWKSSNIVKHPLYISFKVENVLNLACWFSFDTSCPNSMYKTYLFLNFGCSAKVASIFFFLWSTLYMVRSVKRDEGAHPPPSPPQIFAKVDLLPIDSYSEKKKMTSKIQTASNSSKTTGSITLVHSMSCRKLIFIDILSFILYLLYLFYLLPWHFYLLPIPLR